MLTGPVITNIASLQSLKDRMGKWNAIKIIPTWGFAWDSHSRAQVRGMTKQLIIRTKQGDPSASAPYLHFEKVREEVLPWIDLFPDSIIELGNEPNTALLKLGESSKQEFLWGYAYHMQATIMDLRQYTSSWAVRPKIIAPAMSLDPSLVEMARLFMQHKTVRAQYQLCDGVAQHIYVTTSSLMNDPQVTEALEQRKLNATKPHYITEANANPFKADRIKPSAIPGDFWAQWESFMYYHINDGDTLDAQYHIDALKAKALNS